MKSGCNDSGERLLESVDRNEQESKRSTRYDIQEMVNSEQIQELEDVIRYLYRKIDSLEKTITPMPTEQKKILTEQVGKLNERYSSQAEKIEQSITDVKKKLIPLLIGIPITIQFVSMTVFILLEIFSK